METEKIAVPKTHFIIKSSIVFLLFIFSGIFQIIGSRILGYDVNNLSNYQELILTTISEISLFLILIGIYFKDLKRDIKKIKKDFNKNMDIAIKWWLLGILVMVVSNLIIGLFVKEATANNEESIRTLIDSSKYLSIFVFGIIGPIVEELVFRKAFRDIIKNDILFVLISGLVFGSLHVVLSVSNPLDLLYLIPYCSLGLAFSIIYQKTKNIYFSMFIHIFHNTLFSSLLVFGIGALL